MLNNILAERYNSIVATAHDTSGLARWLQDQPNPRRRGLKTPPPAQRRLRFAFYGRVSTANHQDPVASHQWQREAATQAIGTAGVIVCDYFDIGCSRSLPWHDRPQASRLLDAIRNPEREFDAIIVGESDRAFSGNQLQQLLPTLTHSNITLWLPELGGPLDPGNPTHRALIALLGNDARREVLRARHRTLTAMRALARDEGRFLGGRPPYGYHLADADRTPTRHTPAGDDASSASNPTRPPPRTSAGSSPSASPGTAPPRSRPCSPTAASPAPPQPTRP
ncbi:recombinase family protein [Actinoplanes sp. CA-252034]|uniref:recombinase family protein n=1 Tax=Actinoplanes sp. CA-252034 TaxID=3239906 RepID=UPI003D951042